MNINEVVEQMRVTQLRIDYLMKERAALQAAMIAGTISVIACIIAIILFLTEYYTADVLFWCIAWWGHTRCIFYKD